MRSEDIVLNAPRIFPVNQVPQIEGYKWLTVSALRHLIFNAEPKMGSRGQLIAGNGLAEIGAIIRLRRRVLIDLNKFDEWINAHRDLGVGGEGSA